MCVGVAAAAAYRSAPAVGAGLSSALPVSRRAALPLVPLVPLPILSRQPGESSARGNPTVCIPGSPSCALLKSYTSAATT